MGSTEGAAESTETGRQGTGASGAGGEGAEGGWGGEHCRGEGARTEQGLGG